MGEGRGAAGEVGERGRRGSLGRGGGAGCVRIKSREMGMCEQLVSSWFMEGKRIRDKGGLWKERVRGRKGLGRVYRC